MLRRGGRVLGTLVLSLAAGCSQPTGPEQPISGERLYNQYCARCHGLDGRPTPEATTASNLAQRSTLAPFDDDSIIRLIKKGRGEMPGFGEQFTEATLQVLVAYVRTLPDRREAGDRPAPAHPPAQ